MYIRKDIHKSLRLEAKMAEGAKCFAWAKLFRECDWLLRKKDREIERLRAALTEIRDAGPMTLDDQRWRIALAALEVTNDRAHSSEGRS